MKFDHVAVNVTDIARSIGWYTSTLDASVVFQDDTWALLVAGGVKIALTLEVQHPAHIAFDLGPDPPSEFLRKAKQHRDGSISRYIVDPDGNAIEWIHYPGKKRNRTPRSSALPRRAGKAGASPAKP
jgi:catechol 2,3-dioxygenase-like lactoylglutathione lyase family enzyme